MPDMHEKLVSEVYGAIARLVGDMSVSRRQTIEDLEAIKEGLEETINGFYEGMEKLEEEEDL